MLLLIESLDLATPYQAAIDACTTGGELIYPPGDLHVASQINWNKKLKHRGSVSGESGSVSVASGSLISGTGITIIRATEAFVAEDLAIVESNSSGDASTIALDINDGATGVTNWELRNCYISGTANALGTGLRTVFGLKGRVSGGAIEGWNYGVDQQASGSSFSNANEYSGVKIRVNATGLRSSSDNVFIHSCTIEGNTTNGIENTAGKLCIMQNHFENSASGANVKITGGQVVSIQNGYYASSTKLDIWIVSGSALNSSYGDTLNFGIQHDGTGVFTVSDPQFAVTTAGTGPVVSRSGATITGLQGMTGQNLLLGSNCNAVDINTVLILASPPPFAAGSKYLVIDASGNVQVSAIGPAS